MKKFLLPENGNFYKVNMHSHSTLSDGKQTPEELKKFYSEHGYSAIAFTEHGKLHDVSYLTDDNFLAIKSYELDMADKSKPANALYEGTPVNWQHWNVIHMNLYAKDPSITEAIDISDLRTEFSNANINEAIRRANKAGFFVIYNHPHWSLNDYTLYSELEGVRGLEITNGAAFRSSDMDYTPHVCDQMSRLGKRLICVGGDDNHDTKHFFQAWTMVKAEELTHDAILGAIEAGHCYASQGPEIYELYVEDNNVHVKCSDAVGIFYTSVGRRKCAELDMTYENPVNEAVFPIDPTDIYFRITVRDARGRRANTGVFWLDEIYDDYSIEETISQIRKSKESK